MGKYPCEAYAELYVSLQSLRLVLQQLLVCPLCSYGGSTEPLSCNGELVISAQVCEVGMLLPQEAAEMPVICIFMGRG